MTVTPSTNATRIRDIKTIWPKVFISESKQSFLRSKSSNKNIVTCHNIYQHIHMILVNKPAIIVERKTRYLSTNLR